MSLEEEDAEGGFCWLTASGTFVLVIEEPISPPPTHPTPSRTWQQGSTEGTGPLRSLVPAAVPLCPSHSQVREEQAQPRQRSALRPPGGIP